MPSDIPRLHLVLLRPEIAPNTGNIGRLSVGLGLRLHLVHPLGFDTHEKAVRRAGLDHWKHVDLVEHTDEAAFLQWSRGRRVIAFSTHGTSGHRRFAYQHGDVLLFGCESKGLPQALQARFPTARIPLDGPIRSLNLSNAVAVATYAALAAIDPERF